MEGGYRQQLRFFTKLCRRGIRLFAPGPDLAPSQEMVREQADAPHTCFAAKDQASQSFSIAGDVFFTSKSGQPDHV